MSKYKQLDLEKRVKLELMVKMGKSKVEIAQELGVHRSTVYRELARNRLKRGGYSAQYALEWVKIRKERYKLPRKWDGCIEKLVSLRLAEKWSPEQISGYYRHKQVKMVSPETIYRYIYANKAKGGEWYKHLRIASKPYRKRYGGKDHRGKIAGKISIEHRPAIVNNRERYGDWEIDTIIGYKHQGALLSMVERKSYFTLLAKLERPTAQLTKTQLINTLAPYKALVHTLTSDNGLEFALHQQIAQKLQAEYYFTHPYSAWQKAINENINGLIRQFIPKNTNIRLLDNQLILQVQCLLNNRPRKSLNWKTPMEVFLKHLLKKEMCRTY
ncbi:MAG: IS30 family transposase [Flavobacteriales bacterium]|nr:IS30 family transposase [Cytophagaceae bacterium]MCX7743499.1 IS30 family transposase [Flavobacteriales bacterium]MDW8457444.1 IS30 family transposase [Cytophagaceae bacterium]